MRRLLHALAGAVVALLLWSPITVPLALRVMRIEPDRADRDASTAAAGRSIPARPTAAVLLSQAGTEITDFLAPFAILAESGAFNVVALAPTAPVAPDQRPPRHRAAADPGRVRRRPSRWPGGGGRPEPARSGESPPSAPGCARARARRRARVDLRGRPRAGANGLLDGHAATTHFAALDDLRATHPQVRWQRDLRYVDDGTVISSAGMTAGIDAALHLVARFAGRRQAARTAAALDLPPPADPAVAGPRLTRRCSEPA